MTACSTLDSQAAVGLHVSSVGIYDLKRGGPLPSDPRIGGIYVDSPRSREVVDISYDRNRGQLEKPLGQILSVGRLRNDLGIHFIVCRRVVAPCRRPNIDDPALARDLVEEDVSCSYNARR